MLISTCLQVIISLRSILDDIHLLLKILTIRSVLERATPDSPTYARLPNLLYTGEVCTYVPYAKLPCYEVPFNFLFSIQPFCTAAVSVTAVYIC